MRLLPSILALLIAPLALAQNLAQNSAQPLLGDWREPAGSVIRIAPCGADLCLTLVHIRAGAPSQFDIHNPDPALQRRALCGLTIGRGFHASSPTHAQGGTLYDPKTGKSYHGEMSATGDQLALRGYIGMKAFGRTETWQRTGQSGACKP